MIADTITHLYRVGERVVFDPRARRFLRSDMTFTVIAQLPPLGANFQYRIKGMGEPYERVALEHQLTLASPRSEGTGGFFKEESQANGLAFRPKPIV